MRTLDSNNKFLLTAFWLLPICAVVISGCSSQPRGDLFLQTGPPLVWPESSETPWLKYVGSLSTEKDLKKERSWLEGFGDAIFGEKKAGTLLNPYSVVVDEEERIFIGDTAGNVVHLMNLETRDYKQIAKISKKEKLAMPVGLALSDKALYVADSVLGGVYVFDKEGRFQFAFGHERLTRPTAIAYNQQQKRLYVTDTAAHAVKVFGSEGSFIFEFGKRGAQVGEFNYPTQLCIDESEKIYVSDTLNYRVQMFSADGTFIMTFGTQGDRPGEFAHPAGIAIDPQGRVYVVDRQFENIQIFDHKTKTVMAFGGEGTGAGQFWLPAGIFIDKQNRFYVADSFNKRIQIFQFLEETKP